MQASKPYRGGRPVNIRAAHDCRGIGGPPGYEVKFYRFIFYGDGDLAAHGWQTEAAEILIGLKSCFKDLTLAEYLSTSIRYAVRQLGFDLLPVARLDC